MTYAGKITEIEWQRFLEAEHTETTAFAIGGRYESVVPTTGIAIVDDGPHCHRGAPVEITTDFCRIVGTVTRRRRQPDGMVKLWYDIDEYFV